MGIARCYYVVSYYLVIWLITFVFHPQKDFYIVHDHIGASFLFLLQKDFGTFHEPF